MAAMEPSLMDDQSLEFSFRSMRRRLHRDPGPPAKLQFQELQLVEDVVLVYGGWAEGPEHVDFASLEPFKQRQVESLHVKGTEYISHRLQTATGNLLVCLESGLPSEPSPSIGFVTAQWFSACVSKQGVEEVKQGKLERTSPGSLAEIISLLALLDFLTATPCSTGFGSTASRIVTLKVREGGAKCVAHVDVRAIFGAPDVEAARHTAVIQLFEGKDTNDAKMSLLEMLRSLRPQDAKLERQLQEAVQLLSAAAACLSGSEVSNEVETTLLELGISEEEWRTTFCEHDDGPALALLGLELYRCAVCSLLESFSKLAGFYSGETTGLDPVKASLTVLETCATPSKWAKDPLQRPDASDEMCTIHAGCVVALRCHILQTVIASRFNRLYGGPFKIESGPDPDPNRERRWKELFSTVDVNGNGAVEMKEWKDALENEDNDELRKLFQFDQKKMRILAKKLFESVHEKADSWVDMEEFRKACRMAHKSELDWHYIYMMAGREAEKADDRPKDKDFAGLVSWNRHCLEHGLTQEDAHLKKYKSHISVQKQLTESKFQAWKQHCRFILRSTEVEEDLNSPGRDATEKVLGQDFDSQLFIKIAFNTSKSFEDVALFGQLTLLQAHILEKIWEALFPRYLPEANGIEEQSNLQLGVHYIIPKDVGAGVYFSLEGWKKWEAREAHLRDAQREELEMTPASSPALDASEASCQDAASEATRSVTSSRIAPPSDATILDGAKVVVEEHCTEYPSRGGDFAENFRTRLPSSISQNLAPPISIDSFTPFQQLRPTMTLVDLHPTGIEQQFCGFDDFTIQATLPRPDSLGSAALASPMSWTSSDVVHQPLTPKAKSSRRRSSASDRSLPRAGAGPVPPLEPAETAGILREVPEDGAAVPSLPVSEIAANTSPATEGKTAAAASGVARSSASGSPDEAPGHEQLPSQDSHASHASYTSHSESASGTEESGESASSSSRSASVQGRLAVELHAEFRRRSRTNSRRRSTIAEDNSGTKFMQMLEEALAEKCGFRPVQIKCKTLECVNENKVGGWNVTLWIYSRKPSMNCERVAKSVRLLVEKYEEWALERRTSGQEDDLFAKYAWAWCKFKAGKDQPYEQRKPSPMATLQDSISASHGQMAVEKRTDPLVQVERSETVIQDLRMAPGAPIEVIPSMPRTDTLQEQALLCDGLIHVHCDVVDKQGLLIHSIAGIRRDFHEALVATTGFLSQEIQVHAMRSSQAERDVVALKAALMPKGIPLHRLRSIHKVMLNFVGSPSSTFFQKFEPVGVMPMHVSSSCISDHQGGMTSTTLVGSQTHSHIMARVDVLDSSQETGLLSEPILHLVENLTSQLKLPAGHVRVDTLHNVTSNRRRVFIDIKPNDGSATVEEMRTLQENLGALDVPSVDYFVHKSLVIESTLCHAFSDDGGSSTLLCHLDVADEHGCIRQNGGPRYLADFVQIFTSIARRFGSSLEPRHLRLWPMEGEYTIDFQIPLHSATDMRLAQQILWTLHKRETSQWIISEEKFQFFRALRSLRPARTCATKLLRDFNLHLQPSMRCQHQALWAEIDVVDRGNNFSCHGGGPLTTNLADFIHIVTGVEAARLTVLGIRQMSRNDMAKHQSISGEDGDQKHYNLKIEVDISDCVTESEDLQQLCESLAGLHRASTQRRWHELPILKQYFFIGAACTFQSAPPMRSVLPRVGAHLDLICKDGAFKQQGVAWRGCVAKMFVDAITQVCGLREEQIVVTCIQRTRTSQQHAVCVSSLTERMAKMELEKKAVSDDELNCDERALQGLNGMNGLSSPSSIGCTVHFEVKATGPHPVELKYLASSLRKLHSQAVRRRYAMLPFFEHFDFDLGVQMQQSSPSGVGQTSEQYLLPQRIGSNGSPVLLRAPKIQSQEESEHFVVFEGHANIIQRGAAPSEYGPCFETQIAGWFLEAWQYHLEEAKLEVQPSQPLGESLTVRMRDDGGDFDFDGLLLRISGVRLREAQTEKVQVGALKPEEVGFEAARVTDGFKAYAVDFEVLRLADGSSHQQSKLEILVEQVQTALQGSLMQLARKASLKRDLKFYRHFEFDRGIQIDDIIFEPSHGSEGQVMSPKTHYSTTPRILDVAVRFHAANSPAVSSGEVKERMVKLLGLESCQLTIVSLDSFGELWEAKMTIRTLTHAPATEETEATLAKVQYLHRCGGHACLRSLGGWKLVAVISNLAHKESDEFHVSCTLQRSGLMGELAENLGFNIQRLQIADVRHSERAALIKLQIVGFSRKRAEMLQDFLDVRCKGHRNIAMETKLCDVKVVAAGDAPVGAGHIWSNDVIRCPTPMHSVADLEQLKGKSLKELMEEYVRCCQSGSTGQEKPYHFDVLKRIEDIIRKVPADAGDTLKMALAQHHIALPLLLDFGQTLMRVVEERGKGQQGTENKEYFLSQAWQPEEMRYALRVLAFVLSWDTRGTEGPEIQPAEVQAHLASFRGVLVKVMDVYKRFLVSLDESDLKRGLYRPCNVMQSLQALLLGIESQPSNESSMAWLAGTDFLDNLSQLLLRNHCRNYSYVHGHAIALLVPQATQMTCKAFFAKHVTQRQTICNNVLKLMRAMLNWLEINGIANSPNWSRSLEDAIYKMSLPQLTWVLDRLDLPPTNATDMVGKLREWIQLDLLHVLDCSLANPMCRSERCASKPEAEKNRGVPLTMI